MNKINSQPTRIKIIGVGGGGNNAVNSMITAGLNGVEYWSIHNRFKRDNTNPLKNILKIGTDIEDGLGTGSSPEDGKKAAESSLEEIKTILEDTDMVFVSAGMGHGIGTGAIPVISKVAKDMGILTIAVVTKPFRFEGVSTIKLAETGIEELRPNVDALIVIDNNTILNSANKNMTLKTAFGMSNEVLYQAIQEITTIITKLGYINADFADLRTVLKDAGTAFIGVGRASGRNRIIEATQKAMNSPLLSGSFNGAKKVLLNIASNVKISLEEVNQAGEIIQSKADPNVHSIWGMVLDETLGDEVVITLVASGCESPKTISEPQQVIQKIKIAKVESRSIFDVSDLVPEFIMRRR